MHRLFTHKYLHAAPKRVAGPAGEDATLAEEELEAGAWGEAELDLGEDGEGGAAAEPFADADGDEEGEEGEGGWEMEVRLQGSWAGLTCRVCRRGVQSFWLVSLACFCPVPFPCTLTVFLHTRQGC